MLALNLKHMSGTSAHCPHKLMAGPAYASQTRSVQMILVRLIAKLSQLIKQLYDVSPIARTYTMRMGRKREWNYAWVMWCRDKHRGNESILDFNKYKCIMYNMFYFNGTNKQKKKFVSPNKESWIHFLFIRIEFNSLQRAPFLLILLLLLLLFLVLLSVLMCMR